MTAGLGRCPGELTLPGQAWVTASHFDATRRVFQETASAAASAGAVFPALRVGVGRSAPREEGQPSTAPFHSLPNGVKVLVKGVPVQYQPAQDEAEAASPPLVLPTRTRRPSKARPSEPVLRLWSSSGTRRRLGSDSGRRPALGLDAERQRRRAPAPQGGRRQMRTATPMLAAANSSCPAITRGPTRVCCRRTARARMAASPTGPRSGCKLALARRAAVSPCPQSLNSPRCSVRDRDQY